MSHVELDVRPAERPVAGHSLLHICRDHPCVDDAPCTAGVCIALCGYRLTLWRTETTDRPTADCCVVCLQMWEER